MKKQVSIRVREELWNELGEKYNRSGMIDFFLEAVLNDEIPSKLIARFKKQ
ncbi:unnamed protein product [marine sediment metagenome]|uniref:Ribbon-helix-helix domain-containing protein n=1 Tax=marine sediment metagenome TaxID=412755 RepID=X1ET99_9ZZZZ